MGVTIEAEVIKKFQDVAKVQQIGVDRVGRPRYMVYITSIARIANFKKGDLLLVSLNKIGSKPTRGSNPNSAETLKKIAEERTIPEKDPEDFGGEDEPI